MTKQRASVLVLAVLAALAASTPAEARRSLRPAQPSVEVHYEALEALRNSILFEGQAQYQMMPPAEAPAAPSAVPQQRGRLVWQEGPPGIPQKRETIAQTPPVTQPPKATEAFVEQPPEPKKPEPIAQTKLPPKPKPVEIAPPPVMPAAPEIPTVGELLKQQEGNLPAAPTLPELPSVPELPEPVATPTPSPDPLPLAQTTLPNPPELPPLPEVPTLETIPDAPALPEPTVTADVPALPSLPELAALPDLPPVVADREEISPAVSAISDLPVPDLETLPPAPPPNIPARESVALPDPIAELPSLEMPAAPVLELPQELDELPPLPDMEPLPEAPVAVDAPFVEVELPPVPEITPPTNLPQTLPQEIDAEAELPAIKLPGKASFAEHEAPALPPLAEESELPSPPELPPLPEAAPSAPLPPALPSLDKVTSAGNRNIALEIARKHSSGADQATPSFDDAPLLPPLVTDDEEPSSTYLADSSQPAPITEPEAASPSVSGELAMTIDFSASENDIPLSSQPQLKALADRLKKEEARGVTVVAYASGSDDMSSMAKRVSLSRALAVRAFLIDLGIENLRINVQARGNEGGDSERTDIFIN
jgi:outer membrane protein OmpA-like peptidoglycan-associated protein